MSKHYTKEFKVSACELVVKENKKISVVSQFMGIPLSELYRWVDAYNIYGDDAFVGSGHLRRQDARLKKLEHDNEVLREENEILKKAAAYCARLKG